MVSREPPAGPGPSGEGSQEKAMTVRSVLLNRDSPDIESRLQRRRNRTQQVRFKDLEEGSPCPAAPGPTTPRASPPPRDAPEPAALCASRRSWPQAQPCSLMLPMPRRACASAAIQTSPSLQKPFPAAQPRSSSVCDVAGARGPSAALGSTHCWGASAPPPSAQAVPPRVPGSVPAPERAVPPAPHSMACRPPPPPPRDPCPPYPGTAGCPTARCSSPATSCPPELHARRCGKPRGGRGPPQRPASVPCGQSQPPAETWGLGRSDSECSLPRRPPPPQQMRGPHQPAQGTPPRGPSPPQHQLCSSPWGGPCCTPPALIPPAPGRLGSATTAPETTPAAPGRQDTQGPCSRLHGQAGPEGHGGPLPAPPQGPSTGAAEPPRHGQPCLTAQQSETLRHVQDLLQLVVAAKGPAGDECGRTSQGQSPAGTRGDLQSQLQSLEGVLETSQQTIRVLLDVIQDLEKKEAQRDGRHSYRTGQDIANCGTCRDCACIIYSVEHDFRQQEGRFQRVLSHMEGSTEQSSPAPGPGPPARQEPSPPARPPAKLDSKKSRRKCFWFL